MGEEAVQEISQGINPEETRRLLTGLIRSKSLNPPGDVRECAAIIADALAARGLPAEIIEDKPGVANVVSHLNGERSGRTLIWNGHFDVVTPGEDWEVKEPSIFQLRPVARMLHTA